MMCLLYNRKIYWRGTWMSMPSCMPLSARWHSALHHQGTKSLCSKGWGIMEQRMLLKQSTAMVQKNDGAMGSLAQRLEGRLGTGHALPSRELPGGTAAYGV